MAPFAKSRRFLFCCYRDNDREFTGIELRAQDSFFFLFSFSKLILYVNLV